MGLQIAVNGVTFHCYFYTRIYGHNGIFLHERGMFLIIFTPLCPYFYLKNACDMQSSRRRTIIKGFISYCHFYRPHTPPYIAVSHILTNVRHYSCRAYIKTAPDDCHRGLRARGKAFRVLMGKHDPNLLYPFCGTSQTLRNIT